MFPLIKSGSFGIVAGIHLEELAGTPRRDMIGPCRGYFGAALIGSRTSLIKAMFEPEALLETLMRAVRLSACLNLKPCSKH
jgi:hypothetical protein